MKTTPPLPRRRFFSLILPAAGLSAWLTLPTAARAQEKAAEKFDPAKVETTTIPLELFKVPEGLEVTLWAQSPMLFNPTNLDVDKDGRIWVAEGVRYRRQHDQQPEGDRIVVLEDTDGDGKAD
ncbi:MAG: hypothetical protein KDM91_14965, partial [Verrucomicrobiae bacterium]|nr:hypothetical protein [Verrucomicrobiae bacterium]